MLRCGCGNSAGGRRDVSRANASDRRGQTFRHPLVGHERDGLTRHDAHQPGRKALPQRPDPFFLGYQTQRRHEAVVLGCLSRYDYLHMWFISFWKAFWATKGGEGGGGGLQELAT